MVVLRSLLMPIGMLIAAFVNTPVAESTELTYYLLLAGCERRCDVLYPRPVVKDAPRVDAAHTPYIDYDEVKRFACLQACRMALTVYPKNEDEIRRFDFSNRNHEDYPTTTTSTE
ncbi:wax ester/triacylglycerol synthase family O-acyltransferase [Babesia caballi]|uniref:Wax ester/triacylglycerol synthase family O-acyltransferase n=1 Tax=Babesia caballi TaxID=5871 RepID=A0AAV4LLX0_BABCB|nr:wax ester/triacylglycerol synthase family O-acyltransferase [Babesia caballi]